MTAEPYKSFLKNIYHHLNNIYYYYYPYRAFGGHNKNRVFHALCDKEGNIINIARAILLIFARALCDQSFNIDMS